MSIKKNRVILKMYNTVRAFVTRFSPELTSKITYRVSWGRKLDLDNPDDFNQKIMWLKLRKYANDPEVTQCVDKYGVRQYITNRNCGEILNELIGVYDSVDEIPWEELPNKFVLKLTHSCGANIICRDKKNIDKKGTIKQLRKWYKEDYYLKNAEIQYRNVPKRIICEKYIESFANTPIDYKFFCFYGEPEIVLVVADREKHIRKHFYDMEWNYLCCKGERGDYIEKPVSLERMIEYCRKLAGQFPFVRMDFYEENGNPVFGEMTFTPAGGIGKSYDSNIYKLLGDKIVIPPTNTNL